MDLIEVKADEAQSSPEIARLVESCRSHADAFLFLAGGASKMPEEAKAKLLDLLTSTLRELAVRGLRFAVGDGGTKAGLMEAAGLARRASGDAFLLLGVCPAPEVLPAGGPGRTPIEPNHSHVVAVHDAAWTDMQKSRGWDPGHGYWGSEVDSMYEIFGRLADGRPSVALVANGGTITLDEVRKNIEQGRWMIVLGGSGRAADAIVSVLEGTSPLDADVSALRDKAERVVRGQRGNFTILALDEAPSALTPTLMSLLC